MARADRRALWAAVLGGVSLYAGLLGPFAIRSGLRARRAGGNPALSLFAVAAGVLATAFLLIGVAHYVLAALR